MAVRATRPNRHPGQPGVGFADLFRATCDRLSDRPALIDGAERLSFRQWLRHSDALARALGDLGIGRGDVVAFQLPNWWEAAALFTASASIGAVANPILPIFRERELEFVLRQSEARVLFVPESFRGVDYPAMVDRFRRRLPQLANVIRLRARSDRHFADMLDRAAAPPLRDLHPDSLLLLMYTSGTTSSPKGVLHTHATLVSEIHSLERVHGLTAADSTLMPSPLTHISGVLHGIMTPAIVGTKAVLMDRWEPARAVDLIDRESISYMIGAPLFLQDLLANAPRQGSSLRLFSCGGASVSADLMRQARLHLGCIAKRVYGSTEFPTMTTTSAGDADSHGATTEGRAIAPNQIRIVDQQGAAVPSGASGEIQAIGPECFVGYLDPELNREAFTEDGWFRTGDLGSIDADGYLTVTGRLKQIVIRKGEKISIQEVEQLIGTHPDVRDVCVVAVPDSEVGERAAAAVVSSNPALRAADLLTFLADQGLARQKHPERIRIVDELPRTDSGKIQRSAVGALFVESKPEN